MNVRNVNVRNATSLTAAMALTAVLAATAATASAQTIKVGVINTYSGSNAAPGDQLDKGMKLYLKLNAHKLPPGIKVEMIVRDDGGPNPSNAKRLAQELVVRDRVQFLTGVVWTPNAAAIAPIAAEAKVPLVLMVASGAPLTRMSPYIARVSFTLSQSAYPLGQWVAKRFKRVYTVVSDFSPGHEAEEAFVKGYGEGGNEPIGRVRIPLKDPDFMPFLQRVRDANPDAVFAFVPGGSQSTALMKAYADLGFREAGIKLVGAGDITSDEELPNMTHAALGTITVHHYSAAGNRPANKAYVAAYKKEYGETRYPGYISIGAWDGMDAIFYAIREQNGKIDPDRTMELLKHYKNPDSPRGPIAINPETRDILQTEYLREVRDMNGKLANVEIEILGTMMKDPWKEWNKK